MTAATIAALAALTDRAHARQDRRERKAADWCGKARQMAEGAQAIRDPEVSARWLLWSGYCGWLALRHTCMHRAAAQLALGFREHARDNIAAARHAQREATKARRMAEKGVVA